MNSDLKHLRKNFSVHHLLQDDEKIHVGPIVKQIIIFHVRTVSKVFNFITASS